MGSRLELHEVLCGILGNRNAYFQPPASVGIKYPAVVYSRKPPKVLHANNIKYKYTNAYELTLIDEDPDTELVDKLLQLPCCTLNQHFTSDNLNHYVFTLYY